PIPPAWMPASPGATSSSASWDPTTSSGRGRRAPADQPARTGFYRGRAGGGPAAALAHHLFQPVQPRLHDVPRRAEGEADVGLEAGVAGRAPLAGVHVEEDAGHRDDLALESGPEEPHAARERLRKLGHRAEAVERPLGRDVQADPDLLQAGDHEVALGPEDPLKGV